ncbi:hypothetical protein ACFX2H_034133 [Malus domestica]
MELEGEHGAEEARRGDEEHGEKRDELEGGQVLRWKMGREAADLVSRIRQIASTSAGELVKERSSLESQGEVEAQ